MASAEPTDGTIAYSSTLNYVFLAGGTIDLIIGVAVTIAPATWAAVANWQPIDETVVRFAGTGLLAVGIGQALCFRARQWDPVRIPLIMFMVHAWAGSFAGLYGVLVVDAPPIVWVFVVLETVFALVYSYYFMKAPPARRDSARVAPTDGNS